GALALLGGAGHPHTAARVARQPAGQREGRPGHQPVMHVLVGQAPQRAQQREQQQRLLGVDPWPPSRSRRQRRWTAMAAGEPHRQAAQREQMQAGNERQRIEMQGATDLCLSAGVGWRGDGCRAHTRIWNHELASLARELPRLSVSLSLIRGYETPSVWLLWE